MKIDKNIPIPPRKSSLRYPFNKMGPGDSFFVPGKNVVNRVNSASYAYKKRNKGCNFTLRKAKEKGVYGCRIWRIQ